MTHKTDAFAGQHPDDLRKAQAHLEDIKQAVLNGFLNAGPALAASSRIHRNLRELQRLQQWDVTVIVPIARTRWPYD